MIQDLKPFVVPEPVFYQMLAQAEVDGLLETAHALRTLARLSNYSVDYFLLAKQKKEILERRSQKA